MRKNLMRSSVVGLGIAAVAALVFWAYLVKGEPGEPPGASLPPIANVVFAIVLGGVVGLGGAGVTFVFGQYPESARRATRFASIAALVLCVVVAALGWREGKPAAWSFLLFVGVSTWLIGFVSSLWAAVRRTAARKLLDGMKGKGAAR